MSAMSVVALVVGQLAKAKIKGRGSRGKNEVVAFCPPPSQTPTQQGFSPSLVPSFAIGTGLSSKHFRGFSCFELFHAKSNTS